MKGINTFTMARSELRQRINSQIFADYNVIAKLPHVCIVIWESIQDWIKTLKKPKDYGYFLKTT